MRRAFKFVFLALFVTSFSLTAFAQRDPDTDGDGLPDSVDSCPREVGPRENRGCPVRENNSGGGDNNNATSDRDGDSFFDDDDKCPDQFGLLEYGGCPPPQAQDSDGDGVSDEQDACPQQAGTDRGCPAYRPAPPPDNTRCYATPATNSAVNVRSQGQRGASILSQLSINTHLPVLSQLLNSDGETWFEVQLPNGLGYVAQVAVVIQGACNLDLPSPTASPADVPPALTPIVLPDDPNALLGGLAVLEGFEGYQTEEGEDDQGQRFQWLIPDDDSLPTLWVQTTERGALRFGLPANSRFVLGDGSVMPGDGSVVPGDGSVVPGDGSVVPGDGSVMPGDGSVVPGDGSVVPGDGSVVPGDGSVVPGDGSVVPGDGSVMPQVLFSMNFVLGDGSVMPFAWLPDDPQGAIPPAPSAPSAPIIGLQVDVDVALDSAGAPLNLGKFLFAPDTSLGDSFDILGGWGGNGAEFAIPPSISDLAVATPAPDAPTPTSVCIKKKMKLPNGSTITTSLGGLASFGASFVDFNATPTQGLIQTNISVLAPATLTFSVRNLSNGDTPSFDISELFMALQVKQYNGVEFKVLEQGVSSVSLNLPVGDYLFFSYSAGFLSALPDNLVTVQFNLDCTAQ